MTPEDWTAYTIDGKCTGAYADAEIKATIRTHLTGKPDTPGWRSIFCENQVTPVAHLGRIFPAKELMDFYKLIELYPEKESIAIPRGMTRADLPSLEIVLNTPKAEQSGRTTLISKARAEIQKG